MEASEPSIELSESWQLTRFSEASSISPYMLSLAILPDEYVRGYAGSKFPIYVWTNKKLQNAKSADELANLTGRVFNQVSHMFTDIPPLKQINVIMMDDFNGTQSFGSIILGLEEWKNADDIHQTAILSRALIRQWIGGLTTIKSRSEICIQVRLTIFEINKNFL